jgi:hypothetical protein
MKEIIYLARVKIPHFQDRLEMLFARINRPVMSGEIALEICCSLAQVVREMDDLCAAGFYRQVEPNELKMCGMEPTVLAYLRS